MIIDALCFALIHLFHHGIVRDLSGDFRFYPLSGLIWVLLMFVTALYFAYLKKKSGSLYPAIVSHAVFNLVMNTCIFFGLP
jgi:membrane protease YdiL (CAAX protease family)